MHFDKSRASSCARWLLAIVCVGLGLCSASAQGVGGIPRADRQAPPALDNQVQPARQSPEGGLPPFVHFRP